MTFDELCEAARVHAATPPTPDQIAASVAFIEKKEAQYRKEAEVYNVDAEWYNRQYTI